jgi:hypothetical protein
MRPRKTGAPAGVFICGILLTSLIMIHAHALGFEDSPASRVPQTAGIGEPGEDDCRILVNSVGNGVVSGMPISGFDSTTAISTDTFTVTCGEPLRMTAAPDALWRFDHWRGVPEADRLRPTIIMTGPAEITAVFVPRAVTYEVLETPLYDRTGELVTAIPRYEPLWQPLAEDAVNAAPTIDIWYGETQDFGNHGTPQQWINILGNIQDADFSSLSYSLNGGASRPLAFGGDGSLNDGRRLWNAGDFNIEIDKDELVDGPNQVTIRAQDFAGLQSPPKIVTVNYDKNSTWAIPYDIDWLSVTSLEDAVQVVDGKWSYSESGVRTVETGYDRILAVGQGSFNEPGWTEFEITVEVTIHGYDEIGFTQTAPAVGLVGRWQGATDYKYPNCQPKCGWLPVGAVALYTWKQTAGEDQAYLVMWSNESGHYPVPSVPTMDLDQTYYWKMRVENIDKPTGTYSFKMWKKGTQEPLQPMGEFDESMLLGSVDMLESGSILLLSHHVDVTFGDIQVRPINTEPDGTPPQITDIEVIPEPQGATIRWNTDEPASGKVDFGQSAGYGQSVTADYLDTDHSLYIPGLNTESTYHFQITAADVAGNIAVTGDGTFTTQELVKLVSDDFNVCELDSAWQFIDPLNDAQFTANSEQLMIQVPAGSNHDIWPSSGLPLNRAPRSLRQVTDPDGLQVKFEDNFESKTAMQGILVEEDGENFLRASYYHQDGQLKLTVIGYAPGQNKVLKSVTLSDGDPPGPYYLWLEREMGQWYLSYANDVTGWQKVGPFNWPLSVTRAGVFAGNFGPSGQEPAFTSRIDYYFDSQNPIAPEDGQALQLPVAVEGKGKVMRDKECGNPVTLTAMPEAGWRFYSWQGSPLDGNQEAVVTTSFAEGDSVTAKFVADQLDLFLPLVINR